MDILNRPHLPHLTAISYNQQLRVKSAKRRPQPLWVYESTFTLIHSCSMSNTPFKRVSYHALHSKRQTRSTWQRWMASRYNQHKNSMKDSIWIWNVSTERAGTSRGILPHVLSFLLGGPSAVYLHCPCRGYSKWHGEKRSTGMLQQRLTTGSMRQALITSKEKQRPVLSGEHFLFWSVCCTYLN